MKTLIISGSQSPDSRSFILCKEVQKRLKTKKDATVRFVDARKLNITPFYHKQKADMDKIAKSVKWADNIIFGMGVHCYTVNSSLKAILDYSCGDATGKFFGIVCAAGGDRSYLSTTHLTQICMNEWRMMQLPRVVYATGKAFDGNKVTSKDVLDRLDTFASEFYTIGKKLLR